jgi:hypothetical protein
VPLRFPRPVMPVIATGMAAVWVMAGNVPAFADQVRQQEWWLSELHVSQAWQASQGSGVTVAVLSDGVDATQADLAGSVTVGPDLTNSGETASTYVGLQGTPIASLIAGHGHGPGGTSGIIGVAPKARILSVRVTLDSRDPALDSAAVGAGLPDSIAAGIRYAVAHHAKVIDLPLDPGQPSPSVVASIPIPPGNNGTTPTTPPELTGINAAAGGSTAEKAAVAFALRRKVVLVAPAGDNAAGTDAANYPAAYPGVIAVGAFNQNFATAPYSSRQPYVSLTAAGAGITAADSAGGYAVIGSTNEASAVVSGIAALIRSRYPGLSPRQVTAALTTSTVYQPAAGAASGSGHGTVDAQRALAAAGAIAAPASERAGAGALTWTRPGSPGAAPVSSDGLAPRVLRAAIISAGVLILLLAAILAYRAVGRRRRRERKDTSVSVEWARSTQNAYAPYGPGEADRMLEFFAAPSNDPAVRADPFSQLQGASVGIGAATSAAAGSGSGSGGGDSGAAGGGAASGSAGNSSAASAGVGAWVPLGPASRVQSRQPRVSGAPPWEPAAQPDSELPWASVPGPATATAAMRPAMHGADPASDSIWPVTPSTPSTPTAAAGPSPSGRAWEDLAASSPAVRAMPEDGPQWDAADTPRSPSGTDWEMPDSEPEHRPATPEDTQWQQADNDAYRQSAAAESAWPPGDSDAGWQPEAGGGTEPGGETEPGDIDTHWLPAAAAEQWPSADSASQWQPAARDSDARWQLSTAPEPAAADQQRDSAAGARWEPAAEWNWDSPTADSPWAAAGTEPTHEPAAADASWKSAAEPPWELVAEPQPDRAAAGDESPADGDQPFAWRPADRTETFPAVGDD